MGGTGQEDIAVNSTNYGFLILQWNRHHAVGVLHGKIVPADDPVTPELEGHVTAHKVHALRRTGQDDGPILQHQILEELVRLDRFR